MKKIIYIMGIILSLTTLNISKSFSEEDTKINISSDTSPNRPTTSTDRPTKGGYIGLSLLGATGTYFFYTLRNMPSAADELGKIIYSTKELRAIAIEDGIYNAFFTTATVGCVFLTVLFATKYVTADTLSPEEIYFNNVVDLQYKMHTAERSPNNLFLAEDLLNMEAIMARQAEDPKLVDELKLEHEKIQSMLWNINDEDRYHFIQEAQNIHEDMEKENAYNNLYNALKAELSEQKRKIEE